MPIFEYFCKSCHKNFELKVDFDYEGKPKCNFCGAQNAKKLLNVPGIIFKGSGFYKTDSREKTPESKAMTSGKDKAAASEKPVTNETKTDANLRAAKTTENKPEK